MSLQWSKIIGFILGLACLAVTCVTDPPSVMSESAWLCAGMLMLMAVWWVTETIPIAVTALLPLVLIPALGLGSLKTAGAPFASPTIFLFLGGFILGLAIERSGLHKRLALSILRVMGSNPAAQIGGFIIVTAFTSMWVSNTTTAIMMLPIATSIIGMVCRDRDGADERRYTAAVLLSIAYAANIGGLGTLIGTPPNAFLAAYLADHYNVHLSFADWMIIGVPIVIVLCFVCWICLVRRRFRLRRKDLPALIEREINNLGPMSYQEKCTAVIALLTCLAWMFQPLIAKVLPGLNDNVIAMVSGIVIFIFPVSIREWKFLLDWSAHKDIPWSVLLLFGGGLSLGECMTTSGLSDCFIGLMKSASGLPVLLMLVMVCLVMVIITEIASNTAAAATFLPMMAVMAASQGVSFELLMCVCALGASCGFMIPVGTPPNALVFSSGKLSIGSMLRYGFILDLACVVFIPPLCMLLVPLAF